MALGHVLVVEDDHDLGMTLTDILEIAGYPVVTATDGRLALAYLRDAPKPCVILLDLMMPGMDGWEFRRRQLQDPVLSKIPVIIASGLNDLRLSPEFDDVKAFFRKPYEVPKLLEEVARYCTPSEEIAAGERALVLR
jgi:CheY-like chemotaxis protein